MIDIYANLKLKYVVIDGLEIFTVLKMVFSTLRDKTSLQYNVNIKDF